MRIEAFVFGNFNEKVWEKKGYTKFHKVLKFHLQEAKSMFNGVTSIFENNNKFPLRPIYETEITKLRRTLLPPGESSVRTFKKIFNRVSTLCLTKFLVKFELRLRKNTYYRTTLKWPINQLFLWPFKSKTKICERYPEKRFFGTLFWNFEDKRTTWYWRILSFQQKSLEE